MPQHNIRVAWKQQGGGTFAATKPTAVQMEQLSELTSCGAPLTPGDHE